MPSQSAILPAREKRNALIEQYVSFVDFVASRLIKRMGLPGALYDELCAAGYLGLVEAAERFDSTRGADFRPFAFLRIRGAIIDSIRRVSDLSGKAYRHARALQAASTLREELHEERNRTGGNVHASHEKERRLCQLLEYASACTLAFRLSFADAEVELSESESQPRTLEDALDRKCMARLIRRLVSGLPDKERAIIEAYYFEDKSFAQIIGEADRFSKSWVSRLHARGLRRLRERLEAEISAKDNLLQRVNE